MTEPIMVDNVDIYGCSNLFITRIGGELIYTCNKQNGRKCNGFWCFHKALKLQVKKLIEDLANSENECKKLKEEQNNNFIFWENYTNNCKRTFPDFNNYAARVSMLSMGLAGETGEVVDYLKKYIYHNHQFNINKLIEELGDVFWYLSMLMFVFDIDIETVLNKNIEKLKQRYPNGFEYNKSINRKESNE